MDMLKQKKYNAQIAFLLDETRATVESIALYKVVPDEVKKLIHISSVLAVLVGTSLICDEATLKILNQFLSEEGGVM